MPVAAYARSTSGDYAGAGLSGPIATVMLRGALPFVAEASPRSWVHIAYVGTFDGYGGPAGAFELTHDTFAQVLANFDRQRNPVPITYEHPLAMDGQPVPAAGWIHELKVIGDDLWALCEWTERAADMIRAGEYRFCSIVVNLASRDRSTDEDIGAELRELGLTNTPFLDGMEPIRLSRAAAKEHSMADANAPAATPTPADDKTISLAIDKDAIKDALDQLPEDASAEQVMALVEGALKQQEAISGDGKDKPEDPPEEPAAMAQPEGEKEVELADIPGEDPAEQAAGQGLADDLMGKLGEALGTDATEAMAKLEERIDDVAAMLMETPDDGTAADEVSALSRKHARELEVKLAAERKERDALQARVVELEASAKRAEAEKRVDAAIAAGHVLDARKDFLLQLSAKAPDLFEEELTAAEASPAVPQGGRYRAATPKTGKQGPTLDARIEDEVRELSSKERTFYDTRIAVLKGSREERHAAALKWAQDQARA